MSEVPIVVTEAVQNVNNTVAFMRSAINEWSGRALDALDALSAWSPPAEPNAPSYTVRPYNPNPLPPMQRPDPDMLGEVGELGDIPWEDFSHLIGAFDPYDPGPFNPTAPAPNFGEAPNVTAAPMRPHLEPIPIPPEYNPGTMPTPGELEEILRRPPLELNLPTLEIDDIPTFDVPPPPLTFNYNVTPYTPLVVNELTQAIRDMLSGGFAMPAVVQAALVAAAQDRAAGIANAAVRNAYTDFASRNFSMPPGMLAENVNAAREQAAAETNAMNREVFVRAAEWAIENLRTAVAQGIALEQVWMHQWEATERLSLEAAKTAADLLREEYNLQVLWFNTRVARIQMLREIFEARLQAELSKLEVRRLELQEDMQRGELNQQKIRLYIAQLEGVQTLMNIANQRLERVRLLLDMDKNKIDIFKTDVDAWSTRTNAVFSAYETRTRAEAQKVGILEAEARAYAATVSAAADRNGARNRAIEAKLRAIEVSNDKFRAMLQGATAVIDARRDAIAARAQAYTSSTGYFESRMRYVSQDEENRIRAFEANERSRSTAFEVESRNHEGRMQRLLQASIQIKEAMQAVSEMMSSMAAGATSAITAQSSISGSGSQNSSFGIQHIYQGN